MATTIDKTPEAPLALDEELQQLERQENELDDRASSLEIKAILIAALAGAALVFAVAALAVALIRTGGNSNNNSTAATPAAAAGTAMGPGMMSGSAAGNGGAAPLVNGAHVINVRLGEMYVQPSVTTVPAGKVTLRAVNVGMLTHELMIERMPMKFDAPGKPIESAAQGMINDMGHGQSGHMTLTLKPGKYMLFCNVPGHYAAGQHIVLAVTRS